MYGDSIFFEGADSDLLDIDRSYADGAFVVMDVGGKIVGTHAVTPIAGRPGVCRFKRLYVSPDLWGTKCGDRLMQWTMSWALEHKMSRVEFWSDVRFKRAHAFFDRWGFAKGDRVKMDDGAMHREEFFFSCDIFGPGA